VHSWGPRQELLPVTVIITHCDHCRQAAQDICFH
jgi:hypothetical protein